MVRVRVGRAVGPCARRGGLIKTFGRRLLEYAGYRITRAGPQHRFDAMGDALGVLKACGYEPRVVIDAGANVGLWSTLAHKYYPHAVYHLIEPQAACAEALGRVARPVDRVHAVAVTRPGVARVRIAGGGPAGVGTGAAVTVELDGVDTIEVPATTLDATCGTLTIADRTLLKLDLEGHELDALTGASQLLAVVEVIVAEVQFYEIDRNDLPVFADVLAFLRERGFELFDIAALAPRRRDGRLKMGDVVFVSRRSSLLQDVAWR